MTSRSYFGKMNSTLGSVVPLAMFFSFRPLVNWLAAEGLGVVLGDIRGARQVDKNTIDKYRQVDK